MFENLGWNLCKVCLLLGGAGFREREQLFRLLLDLVVLSGVSVALKESICERKHNLPPVTPMSLRMFLFLLQLCRSICQNQDYRCGWRPKYQTRIYGSPDDLFIAEFVSLFLPLWDEFQFSTIPPLLLNG